MLTRLGRKARVDLHLHTNRSDGAFEPTEVLRRCAASGLDLIAITDHDIAPDVTPGVHIVEGRQLRVLAGAEISGELNGTEYHLLVYFPGEVPQGFRDFCRGQCELRADRYQVAMDNLQIDGIPEPDLEALRGERALTRLHLAKAIVDLGHAMHIGEAFQRYLSEQHGNVPGLGLPLLDAIRIARMYGGITSWAHPSVKDAEAHLSTLVAAGLHGIEGLRPHINSRDRGRLRKLARKEGIFLTGGSDWHGWADAKVGLFALTLDELGDFVEVVDAAA